MIRDTREHFNIIHQHSFLRVDWYLPSKSELACWELERRQRLPIGSGEVWFAPPESVMVSKLIFYCEGGSEKHLEDTREIFREGAPWTRPTSLTPCGIETVRQQVPPGNESLICRS